jgi:hypothetical protein
MTADSVSINWNGNLKSGKEALLNEVKEKLNGIPDLTYQIDRNVVDGDRAGIAYTMIGRQTGALNINGTVISPGEKTIAVREGQFLQFDAGGKITEVITVSNTNDFIVQLKS